MSRQRTILYLSQILGQRGGSTLSNIVARKVNFAISASLTSLSPFISFASLSLASIFSSSSSFFFFNPSYVDWDQSDKSSLRRWYKGARDFSSICVRRWVRAAV